ncbi:merozoite surface antigen 2-like [Pimephales promelas]|uniref:merozoite surface antigen 2-like n=1 Tax=Pimephales promelas TaxID=90988 RepID=UPI00195582C8|nr:merozoite surface antigen 2-like [Pimephales promelas]
MNFETSPAVSNLSSLERHMNYHASSPASDITSAENSHRVHQGTYQGSDHTNLGAHKGTNYVAHQGSHYGAHQGTYQEAIHGALQDPNNGAHQGSHNGALQGSHYGAHQGSHYGAHQGSHNGAHQGSHYGAHQGSHNGAHQASHYGAHQGPHNRAHQGSNYGAHQGPHNGAHQGTYQDANNRAHQGSQYGAHQGTLTELVNENPRAQLTSQGNEHTNELSPFKRNVLKLLMEVKAELKEQRAMIQNLQGVPAVPDQEIRCGLQLPLQSLEDFEELERLDETEKNRLIYQLSLLGGHKLEGTIRKMLSHILSNKLASSLNWAGRGEKRSFETSNLSKIMFRFSGISLAEDIKMLACYCRCGLTVHHTNLSAFDYIMFY